MCLSETPLFRGVMRINGDAQIPGSQQRMMNQHHQFELRLIDGALNIYFD